MNELIIKYHNLVAELIPMIIESEINDHDYSEYMVLCAQKKIYLQVIDDLCLHVEDLEAIDHSKKLY